MAALDLFGRRWNLRIIWELRHGPVGFRALQERCDNMSSSVLRQRLTELLDAALVEQQADTAYALTELGHGVYRALRPLVRWSAGVGRDPLRRRFRGRPLALLISKR